MTTVYNTFDFDLETAFMQVLQEYISTNLDWAGQVNIVHGQEGEKVQLPQVAVFTDNVTEEVFQTGIWRANLEAKIRIDLDIMPIEKIRELAAAVIDVLEQTNIMQLLNATGLIVCCLVIPGNQNPIELGDRYAEKTISCEIVGYSGTDIPAETPTVTLTASGFTGGFSAINGTFTSNGYCNVWPYFIGPSPWVLYFANDEWNLGAALPPEESILLTQTADVFGSWFNQSADSVAGGFTE